MLSPEPKFVRASVRVWVKVKVKVGGAVMVTAVGRTICEIKVEDFVCVSCLARLPMRREGCLQALLGDPEQVLVLRTDLSESESETRVSA